MGSDICVRRLTKELRALKKDPMESPKIVVAPNEANILEMHYVIEGSTGTPYEHGIYHGKLLFPKDYPLKPPSVIMLTPSGRFQPNRRLCLSMSDFHPETWNPMWSVSTILTGLYSFMIESAPTLGSIETTIRQKRQLARQSLCYNVRDPTFCKLFPEYVAKYQQYKAEQAAAQAAAAAAASANSDLITRDGAAVGPGAAVLMRNNNNHNHNHNHPRGVLDMQGIMATAAGIIAILSIVLAIRFI